ncbi:peptidylprolyl isomerase [Spiroplasma alleghenense]|uniref:Peptidyl-prolyl cis-trans isomerase n=1 Tax=Spiroplasma alleghenense TaxID=216931 RepID=A0A345Z283_9MOLU|nr:peptidylprolyl isomerase [Spiroplasma alleghenense]AXK50712.1 peptidyl-prolyl cis-trans isomerase [Spiroplasma alleghenense]
MSKINIKIILKDNREMNAELFPEKAPESVNKFLELVKQNYYEDIIFHRVIEGFMIQTGGFKSDFSESDETSPIFGEFSSNGFKGNDIKHSLGVLSMARTMDPNSASSQFFIVTKSSNFLDGEYAAFGKLSDRESEAVAIEISRVKTESKNYHDDVPVEPVIIKEIKIL